MRGGPAQKFTGRQRIYAHRGTVRAAPLHQLANRGGDGDRISICSHNARSDCRSHHPALAAIGLLVRWGVWDTGTRGTPSATLARTHHLSSPIVMENAAVPDVCLLYGGPLACADIHTRTSAFAGMPPRRNARSPPRVQPQHDQDADIRVIRDGLNELETDQAEEIRLIRDRLNTLEQKHDEHAGKVAILRADLYTMLGICSMGALYFFFSPHDRMIVGGVGLLYLFFFCVCFMRELLELV